MSIYVKCDFCIECRRLELYDRGGLVGICQKTGKIKRGFDLGHCIGRARRSPEELKTIISGFVKRTSNPDRIVTDIYSPAVDTMIPVFEDGFVGYHVIEKKRRSRSQSESTDYGPTDGGEE